MMVRATLVHGGQVIDRHEFEVHADSDFAKGAQASYEHFRKNHPGLSLFSDGVEVRFGKP
jgi:hypothetical protein